MIRQSGPDMTGWDMVNWGQFGSDAVRWGSHGEVRLDGI